jgi:hypothetical protein
MSRIKSSETKIELFKAILNRESAQSTIYDEEGHSIVHATAIDAEDGPSLFGILADYGANLNGPDVTLSHSRPIHYIVEKWKLEDVTFCIKSYKKQVEINEKDAFDLTPLSRAVAAPEPRPDVIHFLMKKKAQFPDGHPPQLPTTPLRPKILEMIKDYQEAYPLLSPKTSRRSSFFS